MAQWKRVVVRSSRQKENLQRLMLEYKRPCVKCGIDHPAVLDFHHVDPSTKAFHPNEGIKMGIGIEKMRAELEKCVCMCANCHRMEHGGHLYERVDTPSMVGVS